MSDYNDKFFEFDQFPNFRDICCRAGDLCKQQPNLAPIQSNDEVVSFKLQISRRQPIEKTVKIQKRNNYKQKNIDLFFLLRCVQQ